MTHSLHSPSRLAIWSVCPSWRSDGKISEHAQRGTEEGEKAALWAQGKDEEILSYFESQLRDIMFVHGIERGKGWYAERRLNTPLPTVWGYADLYYPMFGEAVLIELKTGMGNRPEAKNNLQLQAYALAILSFNVETVYAYIIEGDKKVMSQAEFTQNDVTSIACNIAAVIANTTTGARNACSHCGYCLHSSTCPELVQAPDKALTALKLPDTLPAPADYAHALTESALAETLQRVLPLADLVDKYTGALKARAMELLEAGVEVPGWKVKTSKGSRRWIDEQDALSKLSSSIEPEINITELLTPAAIEKNLKSAGYKAAAIKELLDGLTTQSTRKTLQEGKNGNAQPMLD